jgi:hypothetical protein
VRRIEAIEAHLGFAKKPEFVPMPMPHYNPLDQLSMPQSAMDDLVKAVPDQVVRDIVRDTIKR